MKKVFAAISLSICLVSFSTGSVEAKKCVGYCPGVSSDAGNPYGVYKPRNNNVDGYYKKNGQYVQPYTRSNRCKGWSC